MVARETSITAGLRQLALDQYEEAAPRLAAFAELLETDARRLGLIGRQEADRVIERHILESCVLIPHVSDAASLVDVGSGAGLPGVPVAIATGKSHTLVESRARAAGFLRTAIARLSVPATVVQQSAELAARAEARESADVVMARALAPPPVALELMLPFVRPGGRALLLVGPRANDLRDQTARAARELGGADPEYVFLEVPGVLAGRWVMIVGKVNPTPERYPRRPGVPRRRPLGSGVTGVD